MFAFCVVLFALCRDMAKHIVTFRLRKATSLTLSPSVGHAIIDLMKFYFH